MNVRWTNTAEAHLDALYNYISQDSSAYARHVVERLLRRSEQIAKYPFSGRKVPEYDVKSVREIIEGNYRIIYRIKKSQVDVVAIIHCAMKILDS